jgi:hypothetical protein
MQHCKAAFLALLMVSGFSHAAQSQQLSQGANAVRFPGEAPNYCPRAFTVVLLIS